MSKKIISVILLYAFVFAYAQDSADFTDSADTQDTPDSYETPDSPVESNDSDDFDSSDAIAESTNFYATDVQYASEFEDFAYDTAPATEYPVAEYPTAEFPVTEPSTMPPSAMAYSKSGSSIARSSEKNFFSGLHLNFSYVALGDLEREQLLNGGYFGDKNQFGISAVIGVAAKYRLTPWTAIIATFGVRDTYAKKTAKQFATKQVCEDNYYFNPYYDCPKSTVLRKLEMNTNWFSLNTSLGGQFTIPALSQNFHIEAEVSALMNLGENDKFLIAANSTSLSLGGGVSYTLNLGVQQIDIGLKAEHAVLNNYSMDSDLYTIEGETRLTLFTNIWLF